MSPPVAQCPVRERDDGTLVCPVAKAVAHEAAEEALKSFMLTYFEVDVAKGEDLRRFRGGQRWAEEMFLMVNASRKKLLTLFLLIVAIFFIGGAIVGGAGPVWVKKMLG